MSSRGHPHLVDSSNEPCSECLLFKGLVYDHLTKLCTADEPVAISKPSPPRSLESVACEEERKRHHDLAFQAWIKAEQEKGKAEQDEQDNVKAEAKARSRYIHSANDDYTTLYNWAKRAPRWELLDMLNRGQHNMGFLAKLSDWEIREYIIEHKFHRLSHPGRTTVPGRKPKPKKAASKQPTAKKVKVVDFESEDELDALLLEA